MESLESLPTSLDWNIIYDRSIKQTDSFSCGVYVSAIIERIAFSHEEVNLTIGSEDLELTRLRMTLTIVTGKYLDVLL